MSASGYTPLQTYYSITPSAVPTAGNLLNGELAINIADGKLFYKDSSGVVQVIASKAGNVNVSSFSGGTTGLTPSTATTGAITLSGTLAVANGGTGNSTAQAEMNRVAQAVTSGSYLRGDGTNVGMSTLQLTDFPTVTTAKGGTGLTSFTAGDLVYFSTGTAFTKLGIGTAGQVLTVNTGATAPQWSTAAGGSPGGSSTQLQYNNSGAFAGSSALTTDGTNLFVGNIEIGYGLNADTTSIGIGYRSLINSGFSSTGCTAIGYRSMQATTDGTNLVAVGASTLSANTTGSNNTAIGYAALAVNLTASSNTAVGSKSMTKNTSGTGNAALGDSSLTSNTTGSSNTALGGGALRNNTTASYNTAIGYAAMQTNITGANNTAVGSQALNNSLGSYNTAVGAADATAQYGALYSNSTGQSNSAFGAGALARNTSGNQNSAFGYSALAYISSNINNSAFGYQSLYSSTGDNNTAYGYFSGANISTGANNVVVGYQSGTDAVQNITTSSNLIVMGNNSHTAAYIKVSWTVTSDARDKTDFALVPVGLDFICSLTPVAYRFKASRDDSTPSGPIRYGFKAQDILAAEGDSPVIIDNSDPENLKYNQDSMIAALTNAIKELKAEIEALKAK